MMTKITRRMITVLLLGIMMISITGCGQQEEDVLRVGMELKWPPFETTDTSGNPEGISVMIANELGSYLGKKVEIVDLPFNTLITALESEKIDVIIGSMGITEERNQKIDFSDPYMYFKILSVVNNNSGIKGYDDIFNKDGLTFVAPKGFSTLDIAREKANNPKILEFDDKATASLELANGNADVFMVDAGSAVSIAKNYPNDLKVIYEPVHIFPIGMGIRKNNKELLKQLNDFIIKSDELGVHKRIADKYNDVLNELVGKDLEFYLNED